MIKYALDITAEKTRTAEFEGKITAIDRSQAVVEFGLDGSVLHANQNFLDVMGYRLEEVVGQPHRMFMAPDSDWAEYEDRWRSCARASTSPGSSGAAPSPARTSGSGPRTTR